MCIFSFQKLLQVNLPSIRCSGVGQDAYYEATRHQAMNTAIINQNTIECAMQSVVEGLRQQPF